MNYYIKTVVKFNTIAIVMNNNSDAFVGFPEIIEAKERFLSKKIRISELITNVSKPYTEFHGVKSDSKEKLYSALSLAIGTGITVAIHQNNSPLIQALKSYKSTLSRTTIHGLPEMANRVYLELKQNETLATGAGLTAEKLTALKDLTTEFREIIESTDYELSTRKTDRKELQTLITECIHILRDELDPFVAHCKDTFPDFYKAFITLRARKRRGKKKSTDEPALCDISGTVTDSITKLPVVNATILLTGDETVYTTDEDGYYLIDDVIDGARIVNCYAPGYESQQPVQDTIGAGESVIIDFSLVPTVHKN